MTARMSSRFFVFAITLIMLCSGLVGCVSERGNQSLTPATVAITFPADGDFVNERRVRVRGTAEGTDSVVVNGEEIDVVAGEWDVLIPFEEGANTATASAKDAEVSVGFTVDTVAPVLELTAPERGRIVDSDGADELTFEGVATDEGSGLQVLSLDGGAVQWDEQGNFSHQARLEPGYNEFLLKAIDRAGNEATAIRAALHGPLADPTAEIESAAEILVSPGTLDTATEVVEALLTPEQVTTFVQSSLAGNEYLSVDAVTFDALDATITPNSPDAFHTEGYLLVEVLVSNVEITGTATLGGNSYPTTLGIAEATVTTEVYMAATESGDLDISFDQQELALEPDDVTFDVQGIDLTENQRDLLLDISTSVARAAFSELLTDQLFDRLWDPEVLRRQVELFGRTLEFQLVLEQVRISGEGIYLSTAVAILNDRFEEVPQAPGALNLPLGTPTTPTVEGDVLLTTHGTALDRLLHGVWRSGLLNLELVGSDFAGFELPVELNAAALALLLDDRIGTLDTQRTPAGLKLRPQLPPVVSLEPSEVDGALGINLGELLVDLRLLPDNGEPIRVVTVALFVDADVEIEIRDSQLAMNIEASARADIAEEPTIDLNDKKVEQLFGDLISLAAELIGEQLELTAAAELEWLTIENPQPEIHGEENDQLSVAVDVVANPDALQ